jgi:16S rRNA processing protein RimM
MRQYYKIGKIVATFGTEGQMVLIHNLRIKTSLKGLETIFIEDAKDSFLPHFIESVKIKNECEVYLKLEEVDTKEQAAIFLKKDIWLSAEDFKKFASDLAPISLLGYQVYNGKMSLGEIFEVFEQPQQVLCKIEYQGKEVLIPVHEGIVQKVDRKRKELFLILPEGLLDVYTGR